MKIRRAAVMFAAGVITASCSEKPASERENDAKASQSPRAFERVAEVQTPQGEAALRPPSEAKIGRDCVAFVRSTKVVPAQGASADCPGCPAGGTEALSVRQIKTEAVSCSGETCNAVVTIHASPNPGSGERLVGGLTAWIPPEQRSEYLSGHPPSGAGEQVFWVQITYRQRGGSWDAVDFDRAPME